MQRPCELDVPFDFGAFVAERRGLTAEDARALIANWLADYEPRARSSAYAPVAARPRARAWG